MAHSYVSEATITITQLQAIGTELNSINGRLTEIDTELQGIKASLDPLGQTAVADMQIIEQLTETDAVENVLTFTEPMSVVEIYHGEATRQQFVVNGLTIHVPPGYYRSAVGGVPSEEVTIPATVSCIVSRLG